MSFYDLTSNNGQDSVSSELRKLSHEEMDGVASFLSGEVVESQPSVAGGGIVLGPGVSNGRFTQSGTTLCQWHKCTVNISGC